MFLDLLLRHYAAVNRHDLTLTPDDGRAGQPWAESELRHLLSRHAKPYWEVDRRLFDGLPNLSQLIERVGRSADDLHAVRRILVLDRRQIRHFYLAWAAPGRPEVQHDDPPAIRAQFLFRAEEVFQYQFGFLPDDVGKNRF